MTQQLLITKEGIVPLTVGDVAVGNVLTGGLLKKQSCIIESDIISWSEFDEYKLGVEKGDFINYMGHPSTAALVGMEANRVSLQADYGSTLVVIQYDGPRLNEGATELPEGASLVPMKWHIRKPNMLYRLLRKLKLL